MAAASTTAALYAAVSAGAPAGAVPEDAGDKSHHLKDGKGFCNPWPSFYDRNGPAIAWAMIKRRFGGKGNSPDTTPPTVPVRKPTFLPSRQTSTLRATWLGHACYYVEFPGGLRVLFDPVFTARCSPFSWLGPKRYTDMPCQIEDIPIIDAVVISHNHYDHLSHPTILKIREKHPNAHFFAPLGNKQWFTASGVHNMTELDWWDTRTLTLSSSPQQPGGGGVVKASSSSSASSAPATAGIEATIGCLPCQHMSARTGWDRCRTLWASWSVASGGKTVWFGGDTGYRAVPELDAALDDYDDANTGGKPLPRCPAFAQIGAHRGPFDLGLIPIGAYEPRFIMSPMHANPMDSVNIFVDTRCKRALGMHWGTWVLTEEDVLEPPRKLVEALKRKGLKSEITGEEAVFGILDIGESREIKNVQDVPVPTPRL